MPLQKTQPPSDEFVLPAAPLRLVVPAPFEPRMLTQFQSSLRMVCTSEMFSVRRDALPGYLSDGLLMCSSGFPDPFAVITANGDQTKTTTAQKRTLNPYWNESFDV